MYSININIFEFEDYRSYLKQAVEFCRKSYSHFSYRNFAKHAGFSSPNFLLLLINGERNISQEASGKISNAFGLSKDQSKFFKKLVLFNQSIKTEEKSHYAKELAKARVAQNIHLLSDEKFEYFCNWKNIIIRELITKFPGINIDNIYKLVLPELKKDEVENSIELMRKLNLIYSLDSGYKTTKNNITTGDQFVSVALFDYHRQVLDLSKTALDRFKREERNFTATTVGLSDESFKLITEKISQLRKEILVLSEIDKKADKIYQFNFQIFPLTKKIELESI